jgi:hypothetical protein
MNDILDDLNSWLDLLVVDRRYRQQTGEEPGASLRVLSTKSRAYAASWQQRKTQAPETSLFTAIVIAAASVAGVGSCPRPLPATEVVPGSRIVAGKSRPHPRAIGNDAVVRRLAWSDAVKIGT